ncbi:putative E3 ubiquitin-protein ligase [Forsythia ovata]|uniref:RING-type E3 ubiquitin transferase n=1 Tax=Forsythia ovata TaxID=205694 RepID=A0ABD1T893_9LAMI
MGISFSTNRRRQTTPATYYQHHPPPHLHNPPEYYPPYPTHPPLPPHAFPAPPPPVYYPHYHYNACNYTSNFVGGPSFGPFHNGLPASSQVVAPPPPPYIEDQQAKKVKSDVNLHKDTLRLEVDEINPDHHLVSFLFDAMFDGSITIWYFAKEEPNCRLVSSFPETYMPVKIPFQKGLRQKFSQPSGTGIDLGFFAFDELSNPSPKEDVFPLVITAETCPPSYSDDYSNDRPQYQFPHMQITQAVLEKNNEGSFTVKTIRQILWIDGVRYELREIYGIGNLSQGYNENDSGRNCVICMTEPKDTAILPCRHMCLCSDCAKTLRLQSNRCPICRELIEELLEIKINNINQ